MQPKWISGKDILDRWKIQKIDLFRLVQDGLLPHDDLQRIKQAPDYYQKIEELKNQMKILAEYEMPRENYGDVEYDEQGNPAFAEEYKLTLKDLYSSEYESLKTEISEIETYIQNMNITDSWSEYNLPDNTDLAVPLLNDLVNSLFLFDQVESLFNDQEKSDQEDISEIPNKSSDPESGYKNKMIWNGSSWELTFEGVIIKQTFSQKGLKAIAYIILSAAS